MFASSLDTPLETWLAPDSLARPALVTLRRAAARLGGLRRLSRASSVGPACEKALGARRTAEAAERLGPQPAPLASDRHQRCRRHLESLCLHFERGLEALRGGASQASATSAACATRGSPSTPATSRCSTETTRSSKRCSKRPGSFSPTREDRPAPRRLARKKKKKKKKKKKNGPRPNRRSRGALRPRRNQAIRSGAFTENSTIRCSTSCAASTSSKTGRAEEEQADLETAATTGHASVYAARARFCFLSAALGEREPRSSLVPSSPASERQ